MPNWAEYFADNKPRYRKELDELLRIPSISALPEHAGDVRKAAEWVANRMRAAGIEGVGIMETGGHPLVYGEWLHAPGKPTILLYGHFDVQPVDPLNALDEPALRANRAERSPLRARRFGHEGQPVRPDPRRRGAPEDHRRAAGQRQVLLRGAGGDRQPAAAELPRGEPGALRLRPGHQRRRRPVEREPAGALHRQPGLAGLEIDVRGAEQRPHSGLYGGAVHNPLHALVQHPGLDARPDGQDRWSRASTTTSCR